VFQQLVLGEAHYSEAVLHSSQAAAQDSVAFGHILLSNGCHLAWCRLLLSEHEMFLYNCTFSVTENEVSCLNINKEKCLCPPGII